MYNCEEGENIPGVEAAFHGGIPPPGSELAQDPRILLNRPILLGPEHKFPLAYSIRGPRIIHESGGVERLKATTRDSILPGSEMRLHSLNYRHLRIVHPSYTSPSLDSN